MKVEVVVLGSPSLKVLNMVSVDTKQHLKKERLCSELRSCVKVEVAVLGSLSLKVLNNYGLCRHKATFEERTSKFRAQELCESRGGRPGFPVPKSP